jgi:hypothetical protein
MLRRPSKEQRSEPQNLRGQRSEDRDQEKVKGKTYNRKGAKVAKDYITFRMRLPAGSKKHLLGVLRALSEAGG